MKKTKILVVDDEEKILELCTRVLHKDYQVETAGNGREALEKIAENYYDVILLDLKMPDVDGMELLKKLNEKNYSHGEVVIVTGAVSTIEDIVEPIKSGASDILLKPFEITDLKLMIKRILERKRIKELRNVVPANIQFQKFFIEAIQVLVKTLEAKDKYTKEHSLNVAKYAVLIARNLRLSEEEIKIIEIAGYLHDLGKIGIDENILKKPGKLTSEEYEHVKKHPLITVEILEPIEEFREIIKFVKHHHERYDGTGYPDRLKGEEIPIGARILALADAYDAMLSDRPYRKARKKDEVINELKHEKGKQFDPKLVEKFLKVIQ